MQLVQTRANFLKESVVESRETWMMSLSSLRLWLNEGMRCVSESFTSRNFWLSLKQRTWYHFLRIYMLLRLTRSIISIILLAVVDASNSGGAHNWKELEI